MSCYTVIKNTGHKLTPQRRQVLEIIHHTDTHLTAEDIISQVQAKFPGINRSTVYRTLELLEELECVVKSRMDEKVVYHHAEDGHHHHLVCQVCGARIDCNEDLMSGPEKILLKQYGFQASLKHLIISGVCQACLEQATAK